MSRDVGPAGSREDVAGMVIAVAFIMESKQAKKILVTTDFSTTADRACDIAATMARHQGASLILLHVFEPPAVTIPELAMDPRFEEDLQQRATTKLSATAVALRGRGVAVEERLQVGSPPAEIIAALATETDPDLVVLGSHGRRAVPRLLLGSVAEGVLTRVKHPVLIVPGHGWGENLMSASPAETRAPGTPATRRWRVAVGIDMSNSSAAAIAWVRDFRRSVACDVVFVHLYWPAAEYARLGLAGPRDLFEPDPTTIQLLQESLKPVIGTLPGSGETTVRILPSWGPTGERLVEEAVHAEADLLVLGTHHRHGVARLWYGSTAPSALHAARLPILCVSQTPRTRPATTIPRLRSVVAATDLSELGNQAIAHAYGLVRGEKGVVHLLTVHERPLPRPAYAYASDAEGALSPAEERELRARLSAQVPAEAAALGISTDFTIVDGGEASEVICQTAARLGADAITLGSHGRGGVGRAVLGSVAGRVIHRSDRPVFVVRHPTE